MQIIPIAGLNALAWTMCVVDVLLTTGRFYLRWRKVGRLGWGAILNGAALVVLIAFLATYQVYLPIDYNAQLYALGLSDIAPTKRDAYFTLKMGTANVMLFWAVIFLVKASFLALYWGVFSVSRGFRRAWWAVAIYHFVTFWAIFLSVLWHCGEPKHVVDPVACSKRPQTLVVTLVSFWCVLNVFGDLLIIALPLGMLKTLRMERSQKVGLGVLFAIVIIDIVFDILRTIYTASSYLSNFPDHNAVWALCEPTIAVMVCALPSYRGLLSRRRSKSSTSFPGTATSKSNDRQGLRVPVEMDDLSAYSLHSRSEVRSGQDLG